MSLRYTCAHSRQDTPVPLRGEGASSLGPLLSATRAANGAVSSGTRPSRAGEAAPGAQVAGVSGAGASGRCRPDHVTGSGRGPAHCRHSARWHLPNARRHLPTCAKDSAESESRERGRTVFILGGLRVYRFKKKVECNKPLIAIPKVMDAEF